ncbi:conserved hypothetical protein [Paecilomyces variotii No. 5]|uniref:HNH nuclease domain-containing protein n=1 Tax=Byssochlamys spectabilis (strain No. 5 / NBRC 109023) TaxID=1356009 RepID=V5G868_BYSSN|nr:conserved hypothetical protein [Paecilomyces variotii No. 5]
MSACGDGRSPLQGFRSYDDEDTPEVYNTQSEEMADVLAELQQILHIHYVPTAFWACVQVCDIEMLRDLQNTSIGISEPVMPRSPADLAKERDGSLCVLTRRIPIQVTHLWPGYLIPRRSSSSDLESNIPDFWKMLKVFWKPEKVSRWRSQIFGDPEDPTRPMDVCFNMMCLRKDLHTMWTNGTFALRPVSLSEDRKELLVKFYWQPFYSHLLRNEIDLLQAPLTSRGLDKGRNIQGYAELIVQTASQTVAPQLSRVVSGAVFSLRTSDPERLPLPSIELLEMQWYLIRIVSMSGAASEYDNDDDDNDD